MEKKKGFLSGLFAGKKSDSGCCNMEVIEEKESTGSCCDMQIIEETDCTCGESDEKGKTATSSDGCCCGK